MGNGKEERGESEGDEWIEVYRVIKSKSWYWELYDEVMCKGW